MASEDASKLAEDIGQLSLDSEGMTTASKDTSNLAEEIGQLSLDSAGTSNADTKRPSTSGFANVSHAEKDHTKDPAQAAATHSKVENGCSLRIPLRPYIPPHRRAQNSSNGPILNSNDSSFVPVPEPATFANIKANTPASRQRPVSKSVSATHVTGGFLVDKKSRSRPTKFDVFPSPSLPGPRGYAKPDVGSIGSPNAATEEQKSRQTPGVDTGQQPPQPTKRNLDVLRLPSKLPTEPRLNLLERPEPSTAYMDQAHRVIRPVQAPRPLLVVLDLNGTLLHRKKRGSNAFVARPRVYEFLHYLFSTSYVLIWSSAQPKNVKEMCMRLLSKQQVEQLVGTWTRQDLRLPAHAYFQKVQVYKQLSWIWNDSNLQGVKPHPRKDWSQEDTVLIDDSVEKAASEPYNLIKIEEFLGRKEQMDLDVLGQVVKYMETLRSQGDVSAYMREHPFEFKPDEDFDWAPIVKDMQ